MRFSFDPSVNALYIELRDAEVATTVEIRDGVLADFDQNRELIGIEILDEKLFFDFLRQNDGEFSIPEKMTA